MKSEFTEQIRILQDELRELEASPENKRRLSYWDENVKGLPYDGWRLIPHRVKSEALPFVVECEPTCMAKIHGYDLNRYYHDPDYYLYNYLRNMIYKFKTFADCTPLRKKVVVFMGTSFEKSILMGDLACEIDDWSVHDFVLKSNEDLNKLQQDDFFNSKSMIGVKKFHERLVDLIDDDFEICFPSWARSSWGVAWHLMGPEDLIMNTVDDPEQVMDLMAYINNSRMSWEKSRIKYCNKPLELGSIYNDEVASPMISPSTYENLIRPFEMELSKFYGGIRYWHSCGDTTPYQILINKIPDIQLVHVSPWTDYVKAAQNYTPGEKALEVALYGYEHIVRGPGTEQIESKLLEIKHVLSGHIAQVRGAGIEIVTTVEQDIANVIKWIGCANRILLG